MSNGNLHELIVFTPREIARFWAKVEVTEDPAQCWRWKASMFRDGYGQCKLRGANLTASRVAYAMSHGPIPEGSVVRHTCDNPACVNPGHLVTGSAQDNTDDMTSRGRAARGDRNGSRLHPERLARGDKNGARTHPESLARGERVGLARLTEASVREIRSMYATGKYSQAALGTLFGVNQGNIGCVVRRETWAHVS